MFQPENEQSVKPEDRFACTMDLQVLVSSWMEAWSLALACLLCKVSIYHGFLIYLMLKKTYSCSRKDSSSFCKMTSRSVIVPDLSFLKKWANLGGLVEGRDGSRGGHV